MQHNQILFNRHEIGSGQEPLILSLQEQYELASWEMQIKIFIELANSNAETLNNTNENLKEFCMLFKGSYPYIIESLNRWSLKLNNLGRCTMYGLLNNIGILDSQDKINPLFDAALEHLIAKDGLMQEILDEVEFSKFDYLIQSNVNFYLDQITANLNDQIPISQKLADYRQTFLYDLQEHGI